MQTTPYSEGRPDAKICFVAEAPAKVEMLKQRPLMGPTGDVFNDLLQQAGIIRRNCGIENVSRTQIQSVAAFIGKDGLTMEGEALAADLRDRLSARSPNVVVAMGNLALGALTGRTGITKWRGSILDSSLAPGIKVIPTIHPAATLPGRGPYVARYSILDDFRRAKRESEFPEIRRPDRDLRINPSLEEALDFLSAMAKAPRVAFDIETLNHEVSCISFAADSTTAISIPFVEKGAILRSEWTTEDEILIWRSIAEVLENPKSEKIATNSQFDISFLLSQCRIRTRGPVCDPMLLHRILFPDLLSGLDYLCSIYTDEPYYKDDKSQWLKIEDPDTFYRYNARDSVVLPEIWDALWKMAEGTVFAEMYKEVLSLQEPALFLTRRGIRVDKQELVAERTRVMEELERHEQELRDVADYIFNPNSPKECLEYFYAHKGIKPYVTTRKRPDGTKVSTPSVDDKALARLAGTHKLQEARIIQRIRNIRKLVGTYFDIELDDDGRFRSEYRLRGTTTSRLSSAKTLLGTGGNAQNMDPRFRAFLVPDPPPEVR